MRQKISKVVKRFTGEWLEPRVARMVMETRLSAAFARAAATAGTRSIDPRRPLTWEFSGFSQHGEDGILDYLCSRLNSKNQYFVEIGSADGIENCSTWLALGRNYGGVMVEGNPSLSESCRKFLEDRIWNVQVVNMMVDPASVEKLMKLCPYRDPDVFILDIDGIDYHILARVLELEFRPRIIVVEYNSAFGPDQPITVPLRPGFHRSPDPSLFYYGVAIQAWHALLGRHRYRFVTVDSSGCNAFFVDPQCFQEEFISALQGENFRENISDGAVFPSRDAHGDLALPARDWRTQFDQIKTLEFVRV